MLSHRMFVCAWMHTPLSTEGASLPATPHRFHSALYEPGLAELQYWQEFRFYKGPYKHVNVVSANLLTFFIFYFFY